jgi:hypothetical protein
MDSCSERSLDALDYLGVLGPTGNGNGAANVKSFDEECKCLRGAATATEAYAARRIAVVKAVRCQLQSGDSQAIR